MLLISAKVSVLRIVVLSWFIATENNCSYELQCIVGAPACMGSHTQGMSIQFCFHHWHKAGKAKSGVVCAKLLPKFFFLSPYSCQHACAIVQMKTLSIHWRVHSPTSMTISSFVLSECMRNIKGASAELGLQKEGKSCPCYELHLPPSPMSSTCTCQKYTSFSPSLKW